jgi:ferredoxin
MAELTVGERQWAVPFGSNLLDALNGAGCAVPYSCRAGSCHACLVRWTVCPGMQARGPGVGQARTRLAPGLPVLGQQ